MKKWFYYCVLLTVICFSGCRKNDYPRYPIHAAVVGNSPDAIKYFVDIGFDINEKNEDGHTPLSYALRVCGTEDGIVDCLLVLGANPNIPDDDGETPLELAVSLGQNEKAISLLEHGALLQRSKGKKGTLIHEAISYCNADVIKKMLECGGEKLLYTEGDTIPNFPVEKAIDISGDIEINGKEVASILLDHMDLSYTDEHGNNLLHRECIRGDVELIQMLLEKGMDVNAKNNQGLTPLRLARNYNNGTKEEEIVTLLLSCGAKESKKKKEDCEPLMTEQSFLAQLHTSNDLLQRDINQWTPLHRSADLGYENAVNYLLDKGVDVNVLEENNFTPLHLAVMEGNVSVAKLLIENGAKLDIVDNFHNTPLNRAVKAHKNTGGKYELIRLLIDKGAPINGINKSDPPIFEAIGTKDNKALEMLIQRGADVNKFNWADQTPLMQAISSDNIEGFDILLKNSADIHKKNEHGFSALDYLNKKEEPIRRNFQNIIEKYSK